MASGASLGSCDVCMAGILFSADLVSGLLGVSTTSGENWSFFPFFLACWLTAGSSISLVLFLTELSGTYVIGFSTDEGVYVLLWGLLKDSAAILDEVKKDSQVKFSF
jgi:hypothetical protein